MAKALADFNSDCKSYIQHQAVKCFVGRRLVTPFATSLLVHSGQVGEGTVAVSDVDSGFPLQRNLGHSGAKAKILALFFNSARYTCHEAQVCRCGFNHCTSLLVLRFAGTWCPIITYMYLLQFRMA